MANESFSKKIETPYLWLRDAIIDTFVVVDMKGYIKYFNEAYQKMLGYEPAELRKLSYVELTPEKWHAFEADLVERQIVQKGYSDFYEKEYRRKDGTIISVELRALLIRDEAGNPYGMWGIVRDISNRKLLNKLQQDIADDKLRHSEEQFRSLANCLPIGITVVCDYKIVYLNRTARCLHGAEGLEDILGVNILDTVPAALHQTLRAEVDVLLNVGGELGPREGALIRQDGQILDVEVCATSFLYEGRPAVLFIVRDITSSKLIEKAMQESKHRFELLAERNRRLLMELDHRIRNNLVGLLGLVRATKANTKDMDIFAAAIESRLLAMSHIHRTLSDAKWGKVDLTGLIVSIVQEIELLLPHSIPFSVKGPTVLLNSRIVMPLTMILVEWLTNSGKYGAHNSLDGRLEIAWEICADTQGTLIRLNWIERGGPPISQSIIPSLGTELVMNFSKNELRGDCQMSFPGEGAEHMLTFLLAVTKDSGGAIS